MEQCTEKIRYMNIEYMNIEYMNIEYMNIEYMNIEYMNIEYMANVVFKTEFFLSIMEFLVSGIL